MRKAIAIDFDGCLCESKWPEIGAPNWPVIRAAQLAQREGAALILWTCRCGELLDSAVVWCREHGLIFDAVNENLPERLELYGSESRKVSADEYWDDKAVHMPGPPNPPLTLEELWEMDGKPVWVIWRNRAEWAIIHSCQPPEVFGRAFVMVTRSAAKYQFEVSDCGKTWLAYRYKPEEGERTAIQPPTPAWAEHSKARFERMEGKI